MEEDGAGIVKLSPTIVWKGIEAGKAAFTILSLRFEGCTFRFKPGETYLVYAYDGPTHFGIDFPHVTNSCTRTKLAALAEQEVTKLPTPAWKRATPAAASRPARLELEISVAVPDRTVSALSHRSIVSAAGGIDSLRLELHLPNDSTHLGEPFRLRVLLINESAFEVRVAPVFFFSRDHLELHITGPDGEAIDPPSGPIETCSRVDRDWFTLLGLGAFTGADFEISPELSHSINYIYGLEEGCYELRAKLHLHNFSGCFDRSLDPAPVEGTLESRVEEVCFTAPLEERVDEFRGQLDAESVEEVLEALIYFSNVSDPVAGTKIRALLSPPEGWTSRFLDPFHALTALRQQRDPENAPYFHDALGGRFGDLAAEALEDLKSTESP